MVLGSKGCGKTEVFKYLDANINNVMCLNYEKFAE
jgi:hypothetical protein